MTKATITVGVLICAALTGCAQTHADSEGISIRHSAENRVLIDHQAESHCEQFGKKAQRVQRSSEENTYYFRTVVTSYECVPKS